MPLAGLHSQVFTQQAPALDSPFQRITTAASALSWPGSSGGNTVSYFMGDPWDQHRRTMTAVRPAQEDQDSVQGALFVMTPTDDPWTQRVQRTVQMRVAPSDLDSIQGGLFVLGWADGPVLKVTTTPSSLPSLGTAGGNTSSYFMGDPWEQRRRPMTIVRPAQDDQDSVQGGLFVMAPADDPWVQRFQRTIQMRIAPSDRDSVQGGLFVLGWTDSPVLRVIASPSSLPSLGTAGGNTSAYFVDDPYTVRFIRPGLKPRPATYDPDSVMYPPPAPLVWGESPGIQVVSVVSTTRLPGSAGGNTSSWFMDDPLAVRPTHPILSVKILVVDASGNASPPPPLIWGESPGIQVVQVGSVVILPGSAGGNTAAYFMDDPPSVYATKPRLSVKSLSIDPATILIPPPPIVWGESPWLQVVPATSVVVFPGSAGAGTSSWFVDSPQSLKVIQLVRSMRPVKDVGADTVTTQLPFSVVDPRLIQVVGRLIPVRQAPTDRDTTSTYFVMADDSPLLIPQTVFIYVPEPTHQDTPPTMLQNSFIVDDEFRTVRWSPSPRVHPVPTDLSSMRPAFVVQLLDDPYRRTPGGLRTVLYQMRQAPPDQSMIRASVIVILPGELLLVLGVGA